MVMHVVFVAHGGIARTEIWLVFLISQRGMGSCVLEEEVGLTSVI